MSSEEPVKSDWHAVLFLYPEITAGHQITSLQANNREKYKKMNQI